MNNWVIYLLFNSREQLINNTYNNIVSAQQRTTNKPTHKMDGSNQLDDNSDIEEYDIDYEYDDSGHFEFNKNTFERLKKNDPAINSLYVQLGRSYNDKGEYSFFNSINWKEDGDCIVNNTHIKALRLAYHHHWGEDGEVSTLPTRQQLEDFFSCIYHNRSITQLNTHSNIHDAFGWSLIEGLLGHPSITKLDVDGVKIKGGNIGYKVLGKVSKHPESKLKDLRLSCCDLDNERMRMLCDEIVGNSSLKRLDLTGNKKITSVGWQAFSTVLHHPNCKLVQLRLFRTVLNDAAAHVLGTAISGCSSLKDINLAYNTRCTYCSVSSAGWKSLLNQLSQSQSTLVKLNLYNNQVDDAGLAALADIGALKSLDVGCNYSITPSGWWTFFNSLQRRGIQLKKLVISQNNIGDVGIAALGTLLSSMPVKSLELNCISHTSDDESAIGNLSLNNIPGWVTSQGWQTLFTALQLTNLDLVKLDLGSNSIDDERMQLLVPLLSRMSSLKFLSLSRNELVSPTGWQALEGYLQIPNFALNELELNENNIVDDALVAFTTALVQNNTLKRLCLDGTYDEDTEEYNSLITEKGWEAVSTLLCNKTSIIDTYNSNHTLQGLSEDEHDHMNLPNDLLSFLELNENKDKAEVARQKILQTHFSISDDTSKLQGLLDTELEMMPTAISWIGRPLTMGWRGTNVSGLSLMFNLLRKMPDLFNPSAQKKSGTATKRKRDITSGL